jgi:hypothetical protein
VLGSPTPATRLDPLRLLAPPPAKPAELNPPAHVTIVQPPASHHHTASTSTTKHHGHHTVKHATHSVTH